MKSRQLNLILVFSIFILLLVSFYYNNYYKELFEVNYTPAPGIELASKVIAQKFQKPNDSEYYAFKEEDLGILFIKKDKYSNINPVTWNCLDTVYKKSMENRVKVDNLIGRVFNATKISLKAINKFGLHPPPEMGEDEEDMYDF